MSQAQVLQNTRKRVARITDHLEMIPAVYRGRKKAGNRTNKFSQLYSNCFDKEYKYCLAQKCFQWTVSVTNLSESLHTIHFIQMSNPIGPIQCQELQLL